MAELVRSALFRRVSLFTIALWICGFAWLNVIMLAMGRFFNGIAILTDIPYCAATLVLALGIQLWLMRSGGVPRALRYLLTFVMIVVAALISGAVDTATNYWIAEHWVPEMRAWANGATDDWLRASFLYSWVYCLNVAIVVLAVEVDGTRAQAKRLTLAEEAARTAQLTMLRFQLNPHFLFNTLNAISSLVITNRNDRAEQMLERLSAFLRASISSNPTELVPLFEELATVEGYLEVESIRFEGHMEVVVDVPVACEDALVPSFLLQPLVENAIKYAVAPSRSLVTITIAARAAGDRLTLTVSDDGPGPPPASGGTGIGLGNVRARLKAFFGDSATCITRAAESGFVVELAMPLRRSVHPDQAEADTSA